MYFSESSGSRGTAGSASTDQSSCQRLNRMLGRALSCAWAGAQVNIQQAASAMTHHDASWVRGRMKLRDIAPGELHEGDIAITGAIGMDKDDDAALDRLMQDGSHVDDVVAGHFPAIGERQMSI